MANVHRGRRVTAWTGALLFMLIAGWQMSSALIWQETAPEQIIPQETFLYGDFVGLSANEESYQQTAEYKAFVSSGLNDLLERTIDFLIAKDNSGNAKQAKAAVQALLKDGFVVAASVPASEGPPIPCAHFIFRSGGEWVSTVIKMMEQAADREGIEIKKTRMGRSQMAHFTIPNSPGIEVAVWKEGSALVAAAGPNVVEITMDCMAGKRDTLSKNTLHAEIASEKTDFAQTGLFWLDFQQLVKTYGGIPLPIPSEQQVTVKDVLASMELDKLQTVVSRNGYKGKSQWSETTVTGLDNGNTKTFTLDALPPLPVNLNWLSAFSCDPAEAYAKLMKSVEEVTKYMGEEQKQQVEDMVAALPGMLGFDPKSEFLDHLGDVACLYEDPSAGVFGAGITFCMKLKNPEKINDFISKQMDRFEKFEEEGDTMDWPIVPFRIQEGGNNDLVCFDFYGDGDTAFQYGAVQVVENWLVVSLMPQSLTALTHRIEGNIESWTPDEEYQAALNELPSEFSSITMINTRATYQQGLSYLITFLPFLQAGAMEEFLDEEDDLPFYVEEFPPAELITQPLFPNVAVVVPTEEGCKIYSRSSTAGLPLVGSGGSVGSVAAVGVGTALLLPAVQAARGAARKSQNKNNMKQIGLALHNYADVYNHFPSGTVVNEKLKVEERLSWQASILPFLDQAWIYDGIKQDEAWNSEENEFSTSILVTTYEDVNSTFDYDESVAAPTYFVGMAGVGKNAPTLKIGEPGCGIFGYDRETRFRDITDGTSNTIMVIQVNDDIGPWAKGGKSTIRGLSQQPYLNGPDGFGSLDGETTLVLFADGSVREISNDIDPKVMENLSSMADGNVINYEDF